MKNNVRVLDRRREDDLGWAMVIIGDQALWNKLARGCVENPFLCITRFGGRGRKAYGGFGCFPTEQEALEAGAAASLVVRVDFNGFGGNPGGFHVVKERCAYPEYLRMMRDRKKVAQVGGVGEILGESGAR